MKYEEAKKQLQHALKNQQTIRISKLNKLLQSLNISTTRTVEVIKERNNRITAIRWNNEEYVWRDTNERYSKRKSKQ